MVLIMINIYNRDCMEALKEMQDNEFDLAICDPPFGIGGFSPKNHYKNNKGKAKYEYDWNDSKPKKEYFLELKRVSKNQIIWGANYFNCFSEKGGAIVWYKDQKHPNMSKCEIASCSKYQKIDYYRYDWTNTDKYNELRKTDIHPCQKPVSLYEWLLMTYAEEGDKILDTHLGSGSIAIAAHNLNFDLDGYELNKEYYEASLKRLKQHQSQLSMFLNL